MKYVEKTLQVVVLKTWRLYKEISVKKMKIDGSIPASIENKWILIPLDLLS